MKLKAKPKQKFVMVVRDKYVVNLRWPDNIRNRKVMPTEDKANEIAVRFQAACVDGTWMELRKKLDLEDQPITGMKFKEFAQKYLEEYVETYNRDQKSKKSRLSILGQKLDNVPVEALHPQHISQFVAWRKKQGLNNRTVNRDLLVLRHLLEWGVDQQLLEKNPLPSIQMLKEIEWVPNRPYDYIVNEVFAKLDERVLPLFTFLRETGCRREEGLALRHAQLDLVRKEAVIWGVTKNDKSRSVPLTPKAIWAVQALPKIEKSPYVFYHPETLTRWHDCRKPWEQAREAAGHDWLRVHDLRHAFGIKLAEAGCPMHFISEVMGHASIDFTREKYARFSPESAAQAVLGFLDKARESNDLCPHCGKPLQGTQNGNLVTFWSHAVKESGKMGLENSGKSNTIN